MNDVPAYVSILFLLTTFAAVAIFLQAVRSAGLESVAAKILLFLLPLWIVLQTVLGSGGFYQLTETNPPRIIVFGVLPAILLIVLFFIFFREFIDRLPLRLLTIIHLVRIPIEITIYWLFLSGMMPKMMTFQGVNFDILTGVFAILAYFLGFRNGVANRPVLIVFNLVGLALLLLIVTIAALSVPSPLQQMAFDQPNRAVLFFPYLFLPTLVVPLVFASHLVSLYKTLRGNTQ